MLLLWLHGLFHSLALSCAATEGIWEIKEELLCSMVLLYCSPSYHMISVVQQDTRLLRRWRIMGSSAGLRGAITAGRRRGQSLGRALLRRGSVARRVQRRRQTCALVARHEGI
jgi:hypothetical protein